MLMIVAVALLAAFVLAATTTFNLQAVQRVSNGQTAGFLADSAIHEAVARLMEDPEWTGDILIEERPDLPPGSWGYLTFTPGSSRDPAYSMNNLAGGNRNGWNRKVPDGMAHLVGVGFSGGVRRRIECLVHIPAFPIAVASSGPIRCENTLIAGVADREDVTYSEGRVWVNEDDMGPGDLVSNSTHPTAAIQLDERCRITGDVQAPGGLSRNGARVDGEVRCPWSDSAQLPQLEIQDFDPARDQAIYFEKLPEETLAGLTLSGIHRAEGRVQLEGPLVLDNALLYVDGDLTVEKGVRGVGSLMVAGDTVLAGAVNVASDDEVALYGKGSVRLEGTDMLRQCFQGMVYTQGDFFASGITIVGDFIVDAQVDVEGAGTGAVTLKNVGVVRAPDMGSADFFYKEGQAVVFRFGPHTMQPSQWKRDAYGNEYGVVQRTAGYLSTPGNATDLSFTSAWKNDDPALIRVVQSGNREFYSFSWRGRSTGDGSPLPELSTIGPIEGRQAFIDYLWSNCFAGRSGYDVDWPDEFTFKTHLAQTLQRIKPQQTTRKGNFKVHPNKFLNGPEKMRIVMYREL
jgi:hypothetical protein